jgi:hypothetical protein
MQGDLLSGTSAGMAKWLWAGAVEKRRSGLRCLENSAIPIYFFKDIQYNALILPFAGKDNHYISACFAAAHMPTGHFIAAGVFLTRSY